MRVFFRSKDLERCASTEKEAVREWGPKVGRRYVQRVTLLLNTERIADLYTIPSLRFHPLHGQREGTYSLTLIDRWRLLVTTDEQTEVTIEEVSNHYDD